MSRKRRHPDEEQSVVFWNQPGSPFSAISNEMDFLEDMANRVRREGSLQAERIA
jgi:hypothetical protein